MVRRETKEALRPFAQSFWPFFVAVVLLLVVRLPVSAQRSSWPQQTILDAIAMVESGGRLEPPDGDDGRAIGPFQIHYPYWLDAVASEPAVGGSYQDCRNRAYAERVVRAYMRRYALAAWNRGHAETIARIHNGGPHGDRLAATVPYWRKVLRHLPR
jgi:Destabilase